MIATSVGDANLFENAIRLQLRKPKNWNWQLSTSKSSPHISLPLIQLYDSKGQLILETKDVAGAKRQSWHSADRRKEAKVEQSLPKEEKLNYRLAKSATSVLDHQKPINGNSPESLPNPVDSGHQRSRSDDLFRRKLKCDEIVVNTGEVGDQHQRYKMRTSSAGTLVIEESVKRQRRRRQNASIVHPNSAKHTENAKRTDPDNLLPGNRCRAAADDRRCEGMGGNRGHAGLFYSLSEIFPFQAPPMSVIRPQKAPTPNKTAGTNHCDIIEKSAKKKRRKIHQKRHNSDASTSSNGQEEGKPRRNNAKARVAKEQRGGDHHVKMGANVSRHSSKGLSGRRSQSSGSICNNGKGAKLNNSNEGKMCGSLPSYLDDHGASTGCNNNHDCEKPLLDEVERIPPLGDSGQLHWKFSDNQTVLCDQGYGSERSPEEEYPPPLPDHDSQCHHHLEPHECYPFITPDSTFSVKLTKSSRGLGLSVTGGMDTGGSWPGLIRIKRLFPHQPASACGLLNVGDLIIEANGITLTGLTNYEALEVLRTAPNHVELRVCRPPPDVLSCVSPISEVPPPPPRREPPSTLNLHPQGIYCTPEDDYYHGEFEVTLTKIQGSLGFTLRKEDDSALGHYVRALVREPALTDGRVRAGDKIIAVNAVEISAMSHEQAVQFLRQSGDKVRLRLYRDSAQTPVAALSPTETTPRASFSKKTQFRQEAVDMLADIAVRKLGTSSPPSTSPRRLRRAACPSDASAASDEHFHEALLVRHHHHDDDLFTMEPEEEGDEEELDEEGRPSRPSSLDLYNPNQTPVAARKPRFNFSLAHNAYELNNLDPEVLDAPNLTYNLGGGGDEAAKSTEAECGDSLEAASMPYMPVGECGDGFSYKNPAYQSAHPQMEEVARKSAKKAKRRPVEEEVPTLPMPDEYEILAIELNRGWNSRLGFSLQGAAGVTYVSAVHADSVAAKDGRLKPGDRVIKVNDESVENMSTNEIIDLLRIVRGPVCIVVSRIKSREDCRKSNAGN